MRGKLIQEQCENFYFNSNEDNDKDFYYIMPKLIYIDNKFQIVNESENEEDEMFFREDDYYE